MNQADLETALRVIRQANADVLALPAPERKLKRGLTNALSVTEMHLESLRATT